MKHLHKNQKLKGTYHGLWKSVIRKFVIAIVVLAVMFNNPWVSKPAVVEAAVTATVDYVSETITLNLGGGPNTKIYMSLDNKKNWELLEVPYEVDISSILSSKEVTLYFKGNKDAIEVPVVLQAENKTLAPAYKVVSGAGCVVFTSTVSVQYRNGANGTWQTVTSPFYTAKYEAKGTSLYFRTAPSTGVRAGKVVTVKVPKKPNAPSVRLDASKLSITGLKGGDTEYRTGDATIWTTFTPKAKENYLDISTLLGGNTSTNTQITGGVIEVRSKATDKKANSSVKTIEVLTQPIMNDSTVTLTGTTLSIVDNDTKKQYEYTVVYKGGSLDFSKAKWTGITSSKSVVVRNLSLGDTLIVRQKSYTDPVTKKVILPSTYVVRTVTAITPK